MRRLKPFLARKYWRLWIMLACVIVAVMCFEEIADDVFQDPQVGDHEAQNFDRAIRDRVAEIRTPRLTQIMTDITALGSISVIATLFTIFVFVLASFRDFKGIAFVSVVLAGAAGWPVLLKLYFARARPEQADWLVQVGALSFPSGHSFGAVATYLGFAYYASQYARGWAHEISFYALGFVLAALVGVSRIYLGVHFPTDVLAGLSGGVVWAMVSAGTYEICVRRSHEAR